ncbi:MAG: hypothetical protein ACJ78M_14355, partial [Gemmatimonadaceae bacterium]
ETWKRERNILHITLPPTSNSRRQFDPKADSVHTLGTVQSRGWSRRLPRAGRSEAGPWTVLELSFSSSVKRGSVGKFAPSTGRRTAGHPDHLTYQTAG